MKNLKLGAAVLALSIASTVSAQTKNDPWLIGVGAHGVNHMAADGNFGKALTNVDEMFVMNNFKITPPLSHLTVARNLNKSFVLDWQTSVGNVDNKRFDMDKEFFLKTGLGIQYKINSLWNTESWFDPYLRLGVGYLRHDHSGLAFPTVDAFDEKYDGFDGDLGSEGKENFFAGDLGLGMNFWFTKNFGLGAQMLYTADATFKSDVPNFWQASASLLFRFGNTDRDKDGVLDKDDECPDTPGPVENNGCPWPDTDGDGVLDKDDACPDVAGPVENNGCPWPDTDGDGILDKDDECPTVPGLPQFKGCPDTDGDGIPDKDDACPTVFGLKEYNGCPKPNEVVAGEVTEHMRSVFFDFGKATIKSESNAALDAGAKLISAAGGNYLVAGYTDKKGNADYNLKLSRQRAQAVVKALESRGVKPEQLKSKGYGATKAEVPATASDAERQKDRKVVVSHVSDEEWASIPKSDIPAPAKKAPAKKAPAKKK